MAVHDTNSLREINLRQKLTSLEVVQRVGKNPGVVEGAAPNTHAGAAGGIARRGDTADVTTVARIKDDLRAWRLGRCVFVGDAGMYSAENVAALSPGLGRYILAVPMRKVKEVATEVLTRPGRYKPVADNLQIKEVVVGDGERRKRYVLCLNPEEAARERAHREQVLTELCAELNLLRERRRSRERNEDRKSVTHRGPLSA